jgi:hypothetical protein
VLLPLLLSKRDVSSEARDDKGEWTAAPGQYATGAVETAVKASLTPDLLKPEYAGSTNPMAGHCYVATEAMYHLLGGKDSGYHPMQMNHEGVSHWFLKHNTQNWILDPTVSQFFGSGHTTPDKSLAKRKGFLTLQPSKRAQTVITRARAILNPDDPDHLKEAFATHGATDVLNKILGPYGNDYTHGGCLIAAKALQILYPHGRLQALCHRPATDDDAFVNHYVVHVGGDRYLDANGPHTKAELLNDDSYGFRQAMVDATPALVANNRQIANPQGAAQAVADYIRTQIHAGREMQKGDPGSSDTHSDAIIGAIKPFCLTCHRNHIHGVPCYQKADEPNTPDTPDTSTDDPGDNECPDCGCPDSAEHQRRHAEQDHPFLRRPKDYEKAHDVSQEERDDKGEWEGFGDTPLHQNPKSRSVSHDELQSLAAEGKKTLDSYKTNASPITGLDDPDTWQKVKDSAYAELQKSWGGHTYDAHTGVPLTGTEDKYAISAKNPGEKTISLHDKADAQTFSAAMDAAKEVFRGTLQEQGAHLGVFHDDDLHRIDIDPVRVVDTLHDVETIGSYTNAIGGAYHFKSGDGFYPPHVSTSRKGMLPISMGPVETVTHLMGDHKLGWQDLRHTNDRNRQADHRQLHTVGKSWMPIINKAAHDVSTEARGQPENKGEWVAGGGSSTPSPTGTPRNRLPIAFAPLTPHKNGPAQDMAHFSDGSYQQMEDFVTDVDVPDLDGDVSGQMKSHVMQSLSDRFTKDYGDKHYDQLAPLAVAWGEETPSPSDMVIGSPGDGFLRSVSKDRWNAPTGTQLFRELKVGDVIYGQDHLDPPVGYGYDGQHDDGPRIRPGDHAWKVTAIDPDGDNNSYNKQQFTVQSVDTPTKTKRFDSTGAPLVDSAVGNYKHILGSKGPMMAVPADSPEGHGLVTNAGISNLVHLWAQTSNDNHPKSLALQHAAEEEFGLTGTATYKDMAAGDETFKLPNKPFSPAQYAEWKPLIAAHMQLQKDILAQVNVGKMSPADMTAKVKESWSKLPKEAQEFALGYDAHGTSWTPEGNHVPESRAKLLTSTPDDYLPKDALDEYEKNGDLYRDFLRTMYNNTQDQLAAAGVKELTLYRGQGHYKGLSRDQEGEDTLKSRPIGSWTYDKAEGRKFANMNANGPGGKKGAVVFSATVPASRIVSCARTGFGCLGEKEVTILGGTDDVHVEHINKVAWTPTKADKAALAAKYNIPPKKMTTGIAQAAHKFAAVPDGSYAQGNYAFSLTANDKKFLAWKFGLVDKKSTADHMANVLSGVGANEWRGMLDGSGTDPKKVRAEIEKYERNGESRRLLQADRQHAAIFDSGHDPTDMLYHSFVDSSGIPQLDPKWADHKPTWETDPANSPYRAGLSPGFVGGPYAPPDYNPSKAGSITQRLFDTSQLGIKTIWDSGYKKAAPFVSTNTDEDWIKTLSWDLPTDPEKLRSLIGDPGIATLKTLPAWKAAPDSIKQAFTKRFIPVVKAAHDVSGEARGQPQNAGEWVAGASARATPPRSRLPISMGPIISPHEADSVPTTVNKQPGPDRPATVNWRATRMDGLPPEYQQLLLAQVKDNSPDHNLTPEMIDKNLDQLMSEALGKDSTGKKVTYTWTEHVKAHGRGKDKVPAHDILHTEHSDKDAIAAKHWYEEAHDLSISLGKQAHMDARTSCAFVAAFSPRLDWGSNEVGANFCAKLLGNKDSVLDLTPAQLAHANTISGMTKQGFHLTNGKTFASMEPLEASYALLAMMGAATDDKGQPLSNGDIKLDGSPHQLAAPLPPSLAKAIQIQRGGDLNKILGGHKVRSFFNNIWDPTNKGGNDDVTMDTHAVNASMLRRAGQKTVTIRQMFAARSNTEANSKGTYAVFADAYRRLGAKYHMTGAQAQAIVWVHWQSTGRHRGRREDFPEVK